MSKTIDEFGSATALTGAEVVPVNQAGATKKCTIDMIKTYVGALYDTVGTAAAAIVSHLSAYAHGDINHTNRAALDLVTGTNTGDQDLTNYALKTEASTISATAPGTPTSRQVWYNTSDNGIYQRNVANTSWVYKGQIDSVYDGATPLTVTMTGTWRYVPTVLLQAGGADQQLNSTSIVLSGRWVKSLNYTESGVAIGKEITSLSINATGFVDECMISNCPNLTSLSFPSLINGGSDFQPYSLGALTSLDISAMTISGGFTPRTMAVLTSLSVPVLKTVTGNFNPNTMASLTTLSTPALQTVGNDFAVSAMGALTTINMASLTTVGGQFVPDDLPSLTTLNLPVLSIVGSNFKPAPFATIGALTSINLPSIIAIGGIVQIGSMANLTTVTIGSTLKYLGGGFWATGLKLNQASVDNILVRLAALNGTGGTVAYSGQTVNLTGGTNATPSATGLAAKATLVARGCTVTHN